MEVITHNPTSLAWIGDAIMSLYVRERLLAKGYRKADTLQKMNAKIVSARFQSQALETLIERSFFTEEEMELLKRGRNANVHSKAKNASGKEYQNATALEALLGYYQLYHHSERLEEVLNEIGKMSELV